MLTSRLKILPADKAFKRIITKDEMITVYEAMITTTNKETGNKVTENAGYPPRRTQAEAEKDIQNAKRSDKAQGLGKYFKDISYWVNNYRDNVNITDANPDLINMYKQKFEEAIDNGDKEEMKRWFREIMNHVSFTNAEAQSGYDIRNIEEETTANDFFRKVIVTGKNLQLVLMSLLPNEDIGMEVHEDVDQFFRIDEGDGFCEIKDGEKTPIKDGSSIVIKAGTYHNIIAGDKGLKLYTIYAPPNYPPDREQNTKAEAVAEEKK